MKLVNKYKKGAASFYIVAFSTLILMIVAISFATVIISEVERTSNDDLSQSAYDSALAGIEDAKLAYFNYQNCMNQEGVTAVAPDSDANVTCGEILYLMDKANSAGLEEDCEIVWKMLGRSRGDIIEATGEASANNMQQATTCLTMTDVLSGYRGTLSSSNMIDVIKLSFDEGVDVNNIASVRLSWFSKDDATKLVGNNNNAKLVYSYENGFPAVTLPVAAPPVVSLTILQTGPSFSLESFNQVAEGQTNRGTLYFTPKAGSPTNNRIGKDALVKSNDKAASNNPYNVECNQEVSKIDGFACSVLVELPKPIGGLRNSDTFEAILSLPYGQPTAEFYMEFYCEDGKTCGNKEVTNEGSASIAKMKGVQLEVDSTGKANDLYRRVIATLKNKNDLTLSVMGPLELLDADDGNDSAGMKKQLTVTSEYNFEP